jgi:hypothetical protein
MDWRWLLALAAIPIGGIMWHIGGQGHKWVRSFLLPIVLAVIKFIMVFPAFLALLYAPLLMAAIALFSYGLKSPIHILWVLVFGGQGSQGDYLPVEVCTRATCGFLWSLAAIPFAIVSGNWIGQIVYSIFSTIACGLFGVNSNVTVSEVGTGSSVSCSVLI